MQISEQIEEKLTAAFSPSRLDVVDESEKHRGHGGWREGGQTHFHVTIKSAAFATMSRVERHRAIHTALTPSIIDKIHALSLDVSA